jgi:hypothetical protein
MFPSGPTKNPDNTKKTMTEIWRFEAPVLFQKYLREGEMEICINPTLH